MKKLTIQQFIEKAKLVHGDKYDYSLVEYINSRTKVKIICPTHSDFPQTPNSHLHGQGCKQCGTKKRKHTKEQFIERAINIHNNKFDYSKVDYVNNATKVSIICLIEGHGVFEQTPNSHLSGSGCTKCRNEKREGGYKLSKAIKGHYIFSGYLYIIKMFNDQESFIKIGISKNPKRRFIQLKFDSKYNIEIIETQFFDDFNQAIIKEHELHEKYQKFYYIPNNKFGGRYECFKNDSIVF